MRARPMIVQAAKAALRGAEHVLKMAREKRIGMQELWVAAKGAAAFLPAIARGDVVAPVVRARRLARCGECASAVVVVEAGVSLTYCGTPLVEAFDAPRPTCGCLCDASTWVRSKACPQGHWHAPRTPADLTTRWV